MMQIRILVATILGTNVVRALADNHQAHESLTLLAVTSRQQVIAGLNQTGPWGIIAHGQKCNHGENNVVLTGGPGGGRGKCQSAAQTNGHEYFMWNSRSSECATMPAWACEFRNQTRWDVYGESVVEVDGNWPAFASDTRCSYEKHLRDVSALACENEAIRLGHYYYWWKGMCGTAATCSSRVS